MNSSVHAFSSMRRVVLVLLVVISCIEPVSCEAAGSQEDAKALFNRVYGMVFGPKGCRFDYRLSLVGIYRAEGSVTYKKKKIQYEEKRFASWNDGVVAYDVDKSERVVKISLADDLTKDKYMGKFTYDIDDFVFSYRVVGNTYEIVGKLKKAKFFGIRSLTAIVDKKTLHPQRLKVKVAILTANVYIFNFRAGDVDDEVFVFPAQRFKGYAFEDRRK